jgi:lactate racemase
MRMLMHYGRQGLPVDLPDSWNVTVLAKPAMPVVPDPHAAVQAALDAPVGSGLLEQEARGRATACILVCDVTRPVPNGLLLRPLVERLLAAGLRPEGVTILVATGLHRPNEGEELDRLIDDPWVQRTVRVENHDARDPAAHVAVGTTRTGIALALDRRFVEAGVRVAVGLVEPHFMAGWSGGRKLILPGIAYADTIAAFHAARMIGHPGAGTCRLEGNPLHEAQMEMVSLLGRVLSMNVVIDEGRRLSFACFGGIVESHAAAVRAAEPYFRVRAPGRFRTVLASGAGFPLDATYYQAVKGICAGAEILEPGGDLFVVSECAEGFGSDAFRLSQRRLHDRGRQLFRAEAFAKQRADVDEWETVMLLTALEKGCVHLYTAGLSAEERSLSCAEPCTDLVAELAACVERDPARRIAVIPEGPYVAAEAPSPGRR